MMIWPVCKSIVALMIVQHQAVDVPSFARIVNRCDSPAIRADRHAGHPAGVSLEGALELARDQVPHPGPCGAVTRSAGSLHAEPAQRPRHTHLTVWSRDPETMVLPSGLIATLVTTCVWPARLAMHAPQSCSLVMRREGGARWGQDATRWAALTAMVLQCGASMASCIAALR